MGKCESEFIPIELKIFNDLFMVLIFIYSYPVAAEVCIIWKLNSYSILFSSYSRRLRWALEGLKVIGAKLILFILKHKIFHCNKLI